MTDTVAAKPAGGTWRPYQLYVLVLLLMVTICNFLDRIVLGVLQEPIKAELHLTDSQLGLLSGPAFALFYSFAGIPIARLAERFNRATLMAAVTAVWSLMTALCGTARGFSMLLLFRVGVGMGEGGCLPISHSLLADYFTVRQRGLVMSVVSAAPSFAAIIAPIAGGLIAETWGWRAAFIAIGAPGLALALLVKLTLKEPRDAAATEAAQAKRGAFLADAKWLMANRAFNWLFVGGAFIGVANAGIAAFTVSFLVRTHHLPLSQAGGVVGLTGLTGLVGAFAGGVIADRFADDRGRSYVLVPALGSGLAALAYIGAFTAHTWTLGLPMLLTASVVYNLKNGPMYAAVQNIVPRAMRATGAAIFMVAATVLGGSIGPLLAGFVSDHVAARHFPAALGAFATACPGGKAPAQAADVLASACSTASASGLQTALVVVACAFLVSAVCLAMASRTIRIASPDPV